MRFLLFLAALSFSLVASGCSTIGVYDNEFTCPASYNGRCISVPGAYALAQKGQDDPAYDPAVKKTKEGAAGEGSNVPSGPSNAEVSYKESLYKRFDSLLKETNTPVVAPPQVMRVLLLPYKGEGNELYMLRYVYFFVDEPKWVLGDSIVAEEEE